MFGFDGLVAAAAAAGKERRKIERERIKAGIQNANTAADAQMYGDDVRANAGNYQAEMANKVAMGNLGVNQGELALRQRERKDSLFDRMALGKGLFGDDFASQYSNYFGLPMLAKGAKDFEGEAIVGEKGPEIIKTKPSGKVDVIPLRTPTDNMIAGAVQKENNRRMAKQIAANMNIPLGVGTVEDATQRAISNYKPPVTQVEAQAEPLMLRTPTDRMMREGATRKAAIADKAALFNAMSEDQQASLLGPDTQQSMAMYKKMSTNKANPYGLPTPSNPWINPEAFRDGVVTQDSTATAKPASTPKRPPNPFANLKLSDEEKLAVLLNPQQGMLEVLRGRRKAGNPNKELRAQRDNVLKRLEMMAGDDAPDVYRRLAKTVDDPATINDYDIAAATTAHRGAKAAYNREYPSDPWGPDFLYEWFGDKDQKGAYEDDQFKRILAQQYR